MGWSTGLSLDENFIHRLLIYRSFIYLFDQLEKRREDATFVIKASYLEIYNEKVGG